MKIYIIRHGETDWNKVRRLQGRSDIPLNEEGRRLARITGEALSSVNFRCIYTSPLRRAKETAMLVKGDRQIDVIEDERLQEISFGIYEGHCCAKDNYEIPDPDFMNFFTRPDQYHPPEGAESIEELCARTTDFLQELVHTTQYGAEDAILLSTHGVALRGLLSSVEKTDIAHFWQGGVHKNCAVTILDVTDGIITLVVEGKTYYDE